MNRPAYTIRRMQLDDIQQVAEWMVEIPLWKRYKITQDGISAHFKQAIERDDLICVVEIEHEHELCGFAWCILGGAFGRSPYLRVIGVHADFMGMGLGSKLLRYVENECGSDVLFLLVSEFNTDAQRFYERHGYRQIGMIPGYVLPDINELIFYKHLNDQEV